MDYYKINYNKLENLKQIKFHFILIFIIILMSFLIILALNMQTYKKITTYGICKDNILQININSRLSDKLKVSNYIIFNNKKTNFEIKEYKEYELIDNKIYQNIEIIVDENFYHNEVGLVEFYYDKKKYIFSCFRFI